MASFLLAFTAWSKGSHHIWAPWNWWILSRSRKIFNPYCVKRLKLNNLTAPFTGTSFQQSNKLSMFRVYSTMYNSSLCVHRFEMAITWLNWAARTQRTHEVPCRETNRGHLCALSWKKRRHRNHWKQWDLLFWNVLDRARKSIHIRVPDEGLVIPKGVNDARKPKRSSRLLIQPTPLQ